MSIQHSHPIHKYNHRKQETPGMYVYTLSTYCRRIRELHLAQNKSVLVNYDLSTSDV